MRSCANGHSAGNGSGAVRGGPAGPYMLTICGTPLNPVPPCWQDLLFDWP